MVKSNCSHMVQNKNFHKTKKEENKGEEFLILLLIKDTRNHNTGRGQKE